MYNSGHFSVSRIHHCNYPYKRPQLKIVATCLPTPHKQKQQATAPEMLYSPL